MNLTDRRGEWSSGRSLRSEPPGDVHRSRRCAPNRRGRLVGEGVKFIGIFMTLRLPPPSIPTGLGWCLDTARIFGDSPRVLKFQLSDCRLVDGGGGGEGGEGFGLLLPPIRYGHFAGPSTRTRLEWGKSQRQYRAIGETNECEHSWRRLQQSSFWRLSS